MENINFIEFHRISSGISMTDQEWNPNRRFPRDLGTRQACFKKGIVAKRIQINLILLWHCGKMEKLNLIWHGALYVTQICLLWTKTMILLRALARIVQQHTTHYQIHLRIVRFRTRNCEKCTECTRQTDKLLNAQFSRCTAIKPIGGCITILKRSRFRRGWKRHSFCLSSQLGSFIYRFTVYVTDSNCTSNTNIYLHKYKDRQKKTINKVYVTWFRWPRNGVKSNKNAMHLLRRK